MERPLVSLLGPPGAGKSVQAELLAKRRGWTHVSTGELVRRHGDPRAIRLANQGQLAPTDYINQLLGQHLRTLDHSLGVVLDGYPRTLEEVRWLEDDLSEYGFKLSGFVYLTVSQEEALRRMQERGRNDDNQTAWKERWQVFHEEVEPVIAYFRQVGLLTEIDGEGSVEEIAHRIEAVI